MDSFLRKRFVTFVALCLVVCLTCDPLFSQSNEKEPIHQKAVDLVIQGSIFDLNGQYRAALNSYNEALIYAPNTPSILNAIAKDYWFLRKFDSAFEMLSRSLEADPQFLETHELMAGFAIQKADAPLAEREYRKIIELDPTNLEARLRLAEIYLAKKDVAKAIEQYEALVSRDLGSGLTLFELGRLYLAEERYDDAFRVFKDYTTDFPEDEQGYLAVGEVLIAKEDTTAALEWYQNTYEENGDFVTLREQLTMTLVALKDWDTAIQIYNNVAKSDSSDLFSRIRLGELYYARGDTTRAMEIFNQNVESYPDDWRGYYKLAETYLAAGQTKESIPYYQKTIEIKQDHAFAWLRLGQAYQIEGQTDQAGQSFRKAQELAPADPGTSFFLGNFLFQQREFKEAVKYLQISVQKAPNNPTAIGSLAAAYDELGEHDKTSQLYERALEIEPDNAVILNNYSYSLLERDERLEDALEMVTKALAAEPENGAFLDTIGWAYFKLGEYTKALDYIKKSLALREDSAEVLEHLGHVYDRLGESDLAVQYWKRAVELDPERANLLPQLKNN